jgi:hypothetical protein
LGITVLAALVSVGLAVNPPDLSVLPAEFRGVVLYPDGATPVDGLAVRVWDAENEKVIFKTRTDKNGVFQIPELKEGEHYVMVGGVRIDMRLLTARAGINPQPHALVVVVPKRAPMIPILVPASAAAATFPKIMSP